MTGVGLKEAVQVGAGTVVTVAVQVALVPAAFIAVRVHVWVAVGENARDPLGRRKRAASTGSQYNYKEIWPSASFVEDQVRVELPPLVTVAGLNDAEQVGGGTTVTVDAHVFVPPDPLSTVKVHVWVDVGVSSCVPLRALSVLLPRLPVHV